MNWATSEIAYIRLHGRRKWYAYNYSTPELREIIDLTKTLEQLGVNTFYIFFNNDFDGYAPKNALSILEMLQSEW